MTALIDRLKATFCVWFGHSRIITSFLGYEYCARCDEQTGDNWLGPASTKAVLVGHNCGTCRENYAKCTWRDKWFTPYPFTENDDD